MRWLRLAGQTACAGRRGAWRLVLVLCAAAVLTTAMATHAAAAPEPKPSAPTSAQPSPSESGTPGSPDQKPAPDGRGGVAYEDTAQGKAAAKKAQREAKESLRKKLHRLGIGKNDLLDSFHVTDENGIPVSAFKVDSESGDWSDWDLKVDEWLTSLLFMCTKWMIAFACWLLTWALGFKLASLLLKPALAVSDSLYNSVLLQLGLPGLFLAFSGTVAAYHLFFGDRSRGWGELTASLLISALAVTTLASPPQTLLGSDGAVGKARDLGVAVASIVMGGEDPTRRPADAVVGITTPITDELVKAFVVQPSQVLTYGQTFTDDTKDKCATQFTSSRISTALVNQQVAKQTKAIKDMPGAGDILAPGIGGKIEDFVKDKAAQWGMDTFGTKPDVKFEKACVSGSAKAAKKASGDKLAGSAFMFLAAFLVCVLIIGLAGSYLAAQAWLAAEAMLLRCALIVGTLPGPGRAWLWSRGAAIARGLALLVGLVVALGVFVVAVTAVVAAPEKDIPGGIVVRFVTIDILCVGAIIFRKRLISRSRQMAARLKTRVGASKLGGAAAPSDLSSGGGGGRRGTLGKIGGAALMLGLMAATGGSAGVVGGGLGRAGSTRTVRHLAKGAGRLARGAGKTVGAGARAGVRMGRLGLKGTVGLPVYGPRAAHRAVAAAQAVPGQVTGAATQLQDRLETARSLYEPQVRDFADEYWRGIGGRWISNRVRARRGLPPLPSRPAGRSARRTTGPLSPMARRGPGRPPNPAPTVAPRRSRRPQMVPQRPMTPPASSRQASLQQRLHRIRARGAAAKQPAPPPVPPRRPVPPRPRQPRRRS
ncbi:hypothetical protein GCM10012285_60410 [Streptomyces kronopolitis]|uniref:Integral membrane protein n=1 Tax=Streptomyces kronopolitis TaxID=1612435 RepID=A0ABQ2K1R8_9ACTN|nr:hypothetical protein [Streptomyces kronopolitis]GGN61462.1 hypothetical protein GCM10012285_60410 [Streptomyces kronopolitis]